MKKLLFLLILSNGFVLFAQKQDLFFPKYEDKYEKYQQIQDSIFSELQTYQMNIQLSSKEQNQLDKIQANKQIQKGEETLLFDFDDDKSWDLLLVKGTYFGPSPGFQFYANTQNGPEFICENAGDIWKIKKSSQNIVFYYSLPIIDAGESQVLYIIDLAYPKQTYSFKKLYYAQQTVLPPKLKSKPKTRKLTQRTALRFSPQNQNEGNWEDIIEDENYMLSKCIKGNIVAYYETNASYWVLAKERNWQFVAFLPTSQPSENALSHGMENWKTQHLQAYVCGWIEK